MTKADLIAAVFVWSIVIGLAVMALVIFVMNVREIMQDRRQRVADVDAHDDG